MTRPLLSVYGLKWNPFTPDIPSEALWRTAEVEHFCWRVEQQVRDGGFALISGESGTGNRSPCGCSCTACRLCPISPSAR